MNRPIDVLQVEDDEGVANANTTVIKYYGVNINVVSVRTLRDAITNLSTQQYDAVLLDLLLPDAGHDSDKLEALRKIRHQFPRVPVIVTSGLGDDLEQAVIEMGAHDYISKGAQFDAGKEMIFKIRRAVVRETNRPFVGEIKEIRDLVVRHQETLDKMSEMLDNSSSVDRVKLPPELVNK